MVIMDFGLISGDMRRSCIVIWDIYGFRGWSDLSQKKSYQEWAETLSKHSDHPCVWSNLHATFPPIQHLNHQPPLFSKPSYKQTLHSEYHKYSRRKEERRTMRYQSVFSFISNDWIGFDASSVWLHHQQQQPTELAWLEDDDDALQTMQCHHVKWRMYLFLCFCPCTQTTNNNTINRDKGRSVVGYDMMRRK